jgi:hypothetical protein
LNSCVHLIIITHDEKHSWQRIFEAPEKIYRLKGWRLLTGRKALKIGTAALAGLLLLIAVATCASTSKAMKHIIPSDALIQLRGPGDLSHGTFTGTVCREQGAGVELSMEGETSLHERQGNYISPPLTTEFPFKEVIPSWNILCPKSCGYHMELRVSNDGATWSPWFYVGSWGRTAEKPSNPLTRDSWGALKVDYFVSLRRTSFIQVRATLFSRDGKETPTLTLLSLALSSERGDQNQALRRPPRKKVPRELWQKRLNVPYRSQLGESESIAGHICSPTSVSMVMHYWGIAKATADVAADIYDSDHKMYGIWWRAVQEASQFGLEGWVQYFRNWEEVREWIARDQPVIACISFDSGGLSGSPTDASEGHVIVIAGFDEKGDPICNDPAGASSDDGIVVYDQEEFARAWFDKGGVGYILAPRKN